MNAIACILPGPSPLAAPPAALTAPLKLAADFAKASKAPATQAAYGSDFRIFEELVRGARPFRVTSHRCGAVRLPGR
jgi:hypothetical protein